MFADIIIITITVVIVISTIAVHVDAVIGQFGLAHARPVLEPAARVAQVLAVICQRLASLGWVGQLSRVPEQGLRRQGPKLRFLRRFHCAQFCRRGRRAMFEFEGPQEQGEEVVVFFLMARPRG